MARSPLLSALRRLLAQHSASRATGIPMDELRGMRAEARAQALLTRREWLAGAAALAAGAALPGGLACTTTKDKTKPRIAIVGGGISGLSAALTLADAGYPSTVYEISAAQVGGRMISQRVGKTTACGVCHLPPSSAKDMAFDDGQVVDLYGELIDTDHETIQALAKRFGLTLTDALGSEPAGATETYWFGGGYYKEADVLKDFAAIYDALQKDTTDADTTTYNQSTAAGKVLDNMTIAQWIDSRVPGGRKSRLGSLLEVAYVIEYGAEATDLSALELTSMLSSSAVDAFSVFGASDERFRIQGGNQQIPLAIASHLGLGSAVKLGWEFQSIRSAAGNTYTLTFDVDGTTKTVTADYVVLALPFTKLRTLDFAKAGFDALKTKAIQEQGGGRNGKIQMQFKSRLWNTQGPWGLSGGTVYADNGAQLAWDPSRGQPGTSGILVGYTGGDRTNQLKIQHPYGNNTNPDVVADAQAFLAQLEPIFPGLTAQWNGKVSETLAHLDPRFNCSYSYWKPGQASTFGGYERVRQGNVFFCGEHTSVDYLGFMEGAASEGVRAGKEMVTAIAVAGSGGKD